VDQQLHTWVINLDRAPERLARARSQLEALALPWTRLAAVDARALTPAQAALLDDVAYRRKHGMAPSLGELGCYLSHVEVMRALLASELEFALVLEDDVLLHPSLPAVLEGLLACRERWDVAKLSAVHSGTPVPYLEVAPGHWLAVMLSRCTGSSAYVLNRKAAQAYLAGLLPMSLPYDHVFDQGWRFGFKYRLVTPTPCGHDEEIASTIVAAPNRKFPRHKRWGAYAYRLGNELRRARYGLTHAALERLASCCGGRAGREAGQGVARPGTSGTPGAPGAR
jgi:glycosyl transferase family 25